MPKKAMYDNEESPKILIGSCGGLTGSYLSRQFKERFDCYVVGADAEYSNVTKFFCDDFVLLPRANDNSFIDKLLQVLVDKKIDIYIPTHSSEIRTVSRNEERIRNEWNGSFVVSPWETFEELDNKNTANINLFKKGIIVPKRYPTVDSIVEYPVFFKPDSGSGSKNAFVVESGPSAEEFLLMYPNSSFYEYIKGTEYTCDCMFDENGKLIGYNPRIRRKSMGGAVIVTQNDYDFDILSDLEKLQRSFVFKGCVNFQYIVSNEKAYFIDINLRYASGGLPLTVASGIDVPGIIIRMWKKDPITVIGIGNANKRVMYRYFNELFEDVK